MSIFGRKVADQVWGESVSGIAETVEAICSLLEVTGNAVASDAINGWASVSEELASLISSESLFKGAKAAYDGAGKPQAREPLVAASRQRLDTFFAAGSVAFHWGKLHYSDASGAPGQRARWETGFAQKAAITRVRNNGTQFANNALNAAKAGRTGVEALNASRERYEGSGPSLMDIFVSAVPEDVRLELSRHKTIQFAQVAQIGAWCFQRSAILGMIVSGDPSEFLPMVWDPVKLDRFWQHVERESELMKLGEAEEGAALGYLRLKTEYAELFGDDVLATVLSAGPKKIERLALSRVSFADARARWSMDTAIGLGIGIRRPEFVQVSLEVDATPDAERWAEAHDAGLDIPREPDPMSVEEQVYAVTETCRAFFGEYYPNAKAKLDELAPANGSFG